MSIFFIIFFIDTEEIKEYIKIVANEKALIQQEELEKVATTGRAPEDDKFSRATLDLQELENLDNLLTLVDKTNKVKDALETGETKIS